MRSPTNSAGEATNSTVERLRREGLADGTVQTLLNDLPPFEGSGKTPAPGLYACSRRSPWLVVKGELRISLLRLYASNGRDVQLVAQIHVTAPTKNLDLVRLRGYVHDPAHFGTREVPSLEQWWVEALDRHYAMGGPNVELESQLGVIA